MIAFCSWLLTSGPTPVSLSKPFSLLIASCYNKNLLTESCSRKKRNSLPYCPDLQAEFPARKSVRKSRSAIYPAEWCTQRTTFYVFRFLEHQNNRPGQSRLVAPRPVSSRPAPSLRPALPRRGRPVSLCADPRRPARKCPADSSLCLQRNGTLLSSFEWDFDCNCLQKGIQDN